MMEPYFRSEEWVAGKLVEVNIRPTRQRVRIGQILWRKEHRHVTAERVYMECQELGERVSLATVYNTLHQFRAAGLLREVLVNGNCVYCDTNVTPHHHFYNEETGELYDIPHQYMQLSALPTPPLGTTVSGVDVVVRIKPSEAA